MKKNKFRDDVIEPLIFISPMLTIFALGLYFIDELKPFVL